jgi:hypothetical protein
MAPVVGAELFGTRPGPPQFGVPATIVKPALPSAVAGGGQDAASVDVVVETVVLVVVDTLELDVVGTVVLVVLVVGGGPGQAAGGGAFLAMKRFVSSRTIEPPKLAQ